VKASPIMRFLAFTLFLMSSCCAAEVARFETVVAPLPNEDMAAGCHYTLTIPEPNHPIRSVWVIFDRSHDVHDLYSDTAVVSFARRLGLALLLHGHCPGKTPEDRGDMNVDPSKGLGRALLTALDQFAHATGHGELSNSALILLGFSGAGSLCARLVGYQPGRVIAAILSAPGYFEPLGIDTLNLSPQAWAVPELVLAGGADNVTGTSRPYLYFRKYRDQGAPWAFVIQNESPHCCTANAKILMLLWLEAVIKQRVVTSARKELRAMEQRDGRLAFVKTRETDTKDSFGLRTFDATNAKIEELKHTVPEGWMAAGWLPNHTIAKEWLSFVRQEHHPILPLH
jgi:dienelactone hydrolase